MAAERTKSGLFTFACAMQQAEREQKQQHEQRNAPTTGHLEPKPQRKCFTRKKRTRRDETVETEIRGEQETKRERFA